MNKDYIFLYNFNPVEGEDKDLISSLYKYLGSDIVKIKKFSVPYVSSNNNYSVWVHRDYYLVAYAFVDGLMKLVIPAFMDGKYSGVLWMEISDNEEYLKLFNSEE